MVFAGVIALFIVFAPGGDLWAEVPVQRTVENIPSSNGHGAIMLDLKTRRLSHFREHIFAAEEPRTDENGNDLFRNGKPEDIATRDLLYDAYFG